MNKLDTAVMLDLDDSSSVTNKLCSAFNILYSEYLFRQ